MDSLGELLRLMRENPQRLEKAEVPCCLWGHWHAAQLDVANDSGLLRSQNGASSGEPHRRHRA